MTIQHFRLLLIASFVTGLIGGGVDFAFPGLLPEAFHEAQHAQDFALSTPRMFFLGGLGVALLCVVIASYYGLYMLRPWAPRLSLVCTALGLLLVFSAGTSAQSGLAIAASYLASYIWGAAVVLATTTPFNAKFRRRNG